jgi:hypothetical protein
MGASARKAAAGSCEKSRPAYGRRLRRAHYVDDRTIDSHVKRLRKKFKVVDTQFSQIETLYGVGYRYRDVAPISKVGEPDA